MKNCNIFGSVLLIIGFPLAVLLLVAIMIIRPTEILKPSRGDPETLNLKVKNIRSDLDTLKAIPSIKSASETVSISDPILNANQHFLTGLPEDLKHLKKIEIPDGLLTSHSGLWMKDPLSPIALSLPFETLRGILGFNYWSLTDTAASNPERAIDTQPMRILIQLRLRLGDMLPYKRHLFIREAYHLATLALSSQQFTVMIAGLSWLDDIHAYEDARLHHGAKLGFSLHHRPTSYFAKTLWATAGFFDWHINTEVFRLLFENDWENLLILCSALNERLPVLNVEKVSFKATHHQEFQQLHNRIHSILSQCRPSQAHDLWDQREVFWTAEQNFLIRMSSLILAKIKRPDYLYAY